MNKKYKEFLKSYSKFLDLMEKALDYYDKETELFSFIEASDFARWAQTDEKVKVIYDRALAVTQRVDKL